MRMRLPEFDLDLARPRRQELRVGARYRREKMMQFERDLRRVGTREAQNGGSRHGCRHRGQKRAAGNTHFTSRTVNFASDAAQLRRDGRSSVPAVWIIVAALGTGGTLAADAASILASRDRRS